MRNYLLLITLALLIAFANAAPALGNQGAIMERAIPGPTNCKPPTTKRTALPDSPDTNEA